MPLKYGFHKVFYWLCIEGAWSQRSKLSDTGHVDNLVVMRVQEHAATLKSTYNRAGCLNDISKSISPNTTDSRLSVVFSNTQVPITLKSLHAHEALLPPHESSAHHPLDVDRARG